MTCRAQVRGRTDSARAPIHSRPTCGIGPRMGLRAYGRGACFSHSPGFGQLSREITYSGLRNVESENAGGALSVSKSFDSISTDS